MFAVRRLSKVAHPTFGHYFAAIYTQKALLNPLAFLDSSRRSYSNGVAAPQLEAVKRIELRPYQESCLQACIDVLNTGTSRIGVSLPTGSGKTTVFLSLISRMKPPEDNPSANRALIIVNSIELAMQASDQLKRLFPDMTVEIEQGVRCKASGSADVYVALLQILSHSQPYKIRRIGQLQRIRLC